MVMRTKEESVKQIIENIPEVKNEGALIAGVLVHVVEVLFDIRDVLIEINSKKANLK